VPFRKLPFHCCAITFTAFDDPVCTEDGHCFDIVNIVPYVQKHGKHPVTGQPLKLADLIRLNFHKVSGAVACGAPVTQVLPATLAERERARQRPAEYGRGVLLPGDGQGVHRAYAYRGCQAYGERVLLRGR